MLNDHEYTTFKMFVTQMSNYLIVISFQLTFYKTLRYRLARALVCRLVVEYTALILQAQTFNLIFQNENQIKIMHRKHFHTYSQVTLLCIETV